MRCVSYFGMIKSGCSSLSALTSARQRRQKSSHRNREIPDDEVALIKKDLNTMSTTVVALKYGRKKDTIYRIHIGTGYADVKEAT